jgi:hypothetical protein
MLKKASNIKLKPELSSPFIFGRLFFGTQNNNYYFGLAESILSADKSIRYSAVADRLGYILEQRYRRNLQPFMTLEESRRYALQAAIRQSTRTTWEEKLGGTLYSCTRYERLVKVTIPLADGHLLLLTCDVETKNVDSLIQSKVIPRVESFHSQGANYVS